MGHKQLSNRRFGQRVAAGLFDIRKRIAQRMTKRVDWADKTILMILGCQRSGTTLVQDILQRDMQSKVYGEFSGLSDQDSQFGIRLNPLDSVRRTIESDRAGLIILKPLVESQNALKLLEAFGNAKALWMYRDFRDAAVSNINMFGPDAGRYDLQRILDNHAGDWRAERLSDEIRSVVADNFSPEMPPHDAAALFWYVRNSWVFELNLQTNRRVMILSYEHLVASPKACIGELYEFIGRKLPQTNTLPPIHQTSTGQGANLQFSENIERICRDLLDRISAI
ncbi:MAG: sulfotransferase [Phycisphaerae bacterium]|jgi:hypothetical protein|nr:sulfotransferase [Phycisphaerae bacterium]